MTVFRALPELIERAAKAKVPKPKLKPRQRIPGLHRQGLKPGMQSDEFVITLLISLLRGERVLAASIRTGIELQTIRHWQNGTFRARCGIEAEKRYRAQLRADRLTPLDNR